jgi:hypothetical protein
MGMQPISLLKKLAISPEVLSKNEPVLMGGPEISGLLPENWPIHHEKILLRGKIRPERRSRWGGPD